MNATPKKAIHEAADTVTEKARDAGKAALRATEDGATAAKRVAEDLADGARESLSDVGERLAATLNRASAEGQEDALKSRVLGSMAQGLGSASDALRQRSVADLASDVQVLAKRHPGAFMAAAAVAGFALARFVRASAQRRHDHGPRV